MLIPAARLKAALRMALLEEGLCPECCGLLDDEDYCIECGYDAEPEIIEYHVNDDW